MAELDTNSTQNERIVAVFPNEATAERAAAEARNRGARNVAVADPNDDVKALMGEMREETSESWAGPSIAVYTPEMARHIPGPTVAFAIAGAILALPLAFIDFGDVSAVGRIIIAVFAGLVGGGTIGFLAGGFLGARRRANRDLAEERGVVVGIEGGNAAAADALVEAGPIRIDRLANQVPIDTVTSHEKDAPSETTMHQPIPEDEP